MFNLDNYYLSYLDKPNLTNIIEENLEQDKY